MLSFARAKLPMTCKNNFLCGLFASDLLQYIFGILFCFTQQTIGTVEPFLTITHCLMSVGELT